MLPQVLPPVATIVKRSRLSEAKIVRILKEHEAGEATKEICNRR